MVELIKVYPTGTQFHYKVEKITYIIFKRFPPPIKKLKIRFKIHLVHK